MRGFSLTASHAGSINPLPMPMSNDVAMHVCVGVAIQINMIVDQRCV